MPSLEDDRLSLTDKITSERRTSIGEWVQYLKNLKQYSTIETSKEFYQYYIDQWETKLKNEA